MTEINFEKYFTIFTKTIAPETEVFIGMFETIISLTPSKSHVKP